VRSIEPIVMQAIRDAVEGSDCFAQVPYASHPLEVCRLVLECGGSQIAACAAVLHEVVGNGHLRLGDVSLRYGPGVAALTRVLVEGVGDEDESVLLLCADTADHLARRGQMGRGDSLQRDLVRLQLAMTKLGRPAQAVLRQHIGALLPGKRRGRKSKISAA